MLLNKFIAGRNKSIAALGKYKVQYIADLIACTYLPLLTDHKAKANQLCLQEFRILLEKGQFNAHGLMRVIRFYNNNLSKMRRMLKASVAVLTITTLIAVIAGATGSYGNQNNNSDNNSTNTYNSEQVLASNPLLIFIIIATGGAILPTLLCYLPFVLLALLRPFTCNLYDIRFGAEETLLSAYSSLMLADLHNPCATTTSRGLFFHNHNRQVISGDEAAPIPTVNSRAVLSV